MNPTTLISIVIPCRNESGNLEALHAALAVATRGLPEDFEFIYVDDGSTDDTVALIAGLQARHPNIRLIELTRNFGKEIAVTAGIKAARGQAAITLDADLQHPPALIPELIAKWREGAELVVGLRRRGAHHAPVLKRAASNLYYRIINTITDVEIMAGATDYRLLDRVVIDEFNRFTEHIRITRGLIDWLGFRRAYVPFVPAKRHAGAAAYSYLRLFNLALNSFVSMSLVPLKLAGYFGIVIMAISGPLGLFIVIEKFVFHDPWGLNITGSASLAVVLLFLVGIILVSLGLMALYIAAIHAEVTNRPLYVARPERPTGPPKP